MAHRDDDMPEGDKKLFATELALARINSKDRGRDPRAASDYNAEYVMGTVSYVVEVCDLSASGARLRIRKGIVPRQGQHVDLRLMNGRTIRSRVVWSQDSEIGIHFEDETVDRVDLLHFDEMGSDLYRTILKFQIAK